MAVVTSFVRTPRTWLAYGALASYAYCLYGLGPILAFLHADLHLSYTLTSAHSTLWSAGAIITGITYPGLARRFGRHLVFWWTAAASAVGALLFAAGYRLAVTLLAAMVLGIAGTVVLTGTTGILSDEHGPHRDRALIEANTGASAAAVVVPLVIGGLAATPVGWRAGMLVPVAALALLWLRFRGLPLGAAGTPAATGGTARLPGSYWTAVMLVAVTVGIEFCLVFYAALLLRSHTGLSTQEAATSLSVFYAGELAGRIGGSRLARKPGRGWHIVAVALAVTAAGFAVFWLSPQPGIAIAGLGVAGLGVANLYPFSLGLAVATAPGRTDQASGRVQLAIGAATVTAPFRPGRPVRRHGRVPRVPDRAGPDRGRGAAAARGAASAAHRGGPGQLAGVPAG